MLEVVPGPGYLALELARAGFRVTGLDISRSFVRIARENAARAEWPASSTCAGTRPSTPSRAR